MTVQTMFDYINHIAPFAMQESWDNAGFLVGDPAGEVRTIGVSLDITREAIAAAHHAQVQLIVSHHPVIFKASQSFTCEQPAYRLAAHGISAICAHTNLDAAHGGITDVLAKTLGFHECMELGESAPAGLRLCRAETPINATALAHHAKGVLKAAAVRMTRGEKALRTIAFCGGAGASFWRQAQALGADALVTGDCGYHDFLDAQEAGFTLIAAGHFHTEQPGVEDLAQRLQGEFPTVKVVLLPQTCPIMDL